MTGEEKQTPAGSVAPAGACRTMKPAPVALPSNPRRPQPSGPAGPPPVNCPNGQLNRPAGIMGQSAPPPPPAWDRVRGENGTEFKIKSLSARGKTEEGVEGRKGVGSGGVEGEGVEGQDARAPRAPPPALSPVLRGVFDHLPAAPADLPRCLARLARYLRHNARLRDPAAPELRAAFGLWFERAAPSIPGCAFDSAWCEFQRLHRTARRPVDSDPVGEAVAFALAFPGRVFGVPLSGRPAALVAAACWHLSRTAEDADPPGIFYVSARDLAVRLGTSRMTVHRALRALEDAGLVACVERARHGTGRANRYRWTGPRPPGATHPEDYAGMRADAWPAGLNRGPWA